MKFLRLSGSSSDETCSADTVVPRMTKKSTPESTTACAYACVFCGESAPAVGTPASRISATRLPISSGLIGSA